MKTIPITKKQLAVTLIIIGLALSVYTLLFIKPSKNIIDDLLIVLATVDVAAFSALGLVFGCIIIGIYIHEKLVKDKLRFKK